MRQTQRQQAETEALVREARESPNAPTRLLADLHISYLTKILDMGFSSRYLSMDAHHTWISYWIVHSLQVLGADHLLKEEGRLAKVLNLLKSCYCEEGGFSGNPTSKVPHLASTFAAVCCICCVATEEFYGLVDLKKMESFLGSLRSARGCFSMHVDGESDVRATYCAVAIGGLLNLPKELFIGVPLFVASCQSYDGGVGPIPFVESHGGYTFCGLASLCIMQSHNLLDLCALRDWVQKRQLANEGGFQGRCNKLVDSCYSFWVGACCKMLTEVGLSVSYSSEKLKDYVVACCQDSVNGGLCDKPQEPADLYHTCYALSGLAVAASTKELAVAVDARYNISCSAVEKAQNRFRRAQ